MRRKWQREAGKSPATSADGGYRCSWRSPAFALAWHAVHQAHRIAGDDPAKRGHGSTDLVYNKYYVDEIYDALFVNRTKDLGLVARRVRRERDRRRGREWRGLADARLFRRFRCGGTRGSWMARYVSARWLIVWALELIRFGCCKTAMMQSLHAADRDRPDWHFVAAITLCLSRVQLGCRTDERRGEGTDAFSDSHILSTILFTPLVGAILMLFIPREQRRRCTAGWAISSASSGWRFRCR